MLKVLDLFSGIGGFSLGLERTGGFQTVAFCEIDPYCRRVLAKHWPAVSCHGDIATREFVEGEADVITGGFPCQDISFAGHGAGLAGARSGLWRDLLRAIRVVRPVHAIVENVAALLARGMGEVLGDLAEIGYDAEWHCIPASAVGAPHLRDRVWIDAYHKKERAAQGLEGVQAPKLSRELRGVSWRAGFQWMDQPAVLRVDDGLSVDVDGHEALGNSVVPQIPELLGRAILQAEKDMNPLTNKGAEA